MRKVSSVAFLGTLTLVLGGCGLFGGGDTATSPPPAPSPAAAPPPAAPAPGAPPAAQAPNGKAVPAAPTTAAKPANAPGAAGLIQSTDANQRSQQAQRTAGRQDPFEIVVPGTPVIVEQPGGGAPPANLGTDIRDRLAQIPSGGGIPRGTGGAPGTGTNRAGGQLPGVTVRGTNGSPGGSGGTVALNPLKVPVLPALAPAPNLARSWTPPVRAAAAPAIALPPPSPPNIARAVEVSGVIQVGGLAKAIVKAPNEQTRYVGNGDRLANGAVLVKRIETYPNLNPVVVLEENGYEVARAVGAAPLPPEAPPPTAAAGQTTEASDVRDGIKVSGLRLKGSMITGKITNTRPDPVRVASITLRLEEKGSGTLVGTVQVTGPNGTLASQQSGFIRETDVDTFGLDANELTVKLEGVNIQ